MCTVHAECQKKMARELIVTYGVVLTANRLFHNMIFVLILSTDAYF